MAYRFEQDEGVEAGFRRVADEQLAKILGRLAKDPDGETAIHDARKSLKRLKALLKLVRPGLAAKDYKREYATVRDAGRLLSGARDFEVMPMTLAALGAQSEDLDKTAGRVVKAQIEQARRDFEQSWDRGAAIEEAVTALTAARGRVGKLVLEDRFEVLGKGAGTCLSVFRAQGRRALKTGIDEDFHDWRKSAQLHWRHLKLLTPVWPELMLARINVTRALADVLGFDHDLAVLGQFIAEMPQARLVKKPRRALEAALSERQLALRAEARAYGGLLLVDKPAEFRERLAAYRTARAQISALPAAFANLEPDAGDP